MKNDRFIEKYEKRASMLAVRAACADDPRLKKKYEDEVRACRKLVEYLKKMDGVEIRETGSFIPPKK